MVVNNPNIIATMMRMMMPATTTTATATAATAANNNNEKKSQEEEEEEEPTEEVRAAKYALVSARLELGMLEYKVSLKRKEVEEAIADLHDARKATRQATFKAAARKAGLFASAPAAAAAAVDDEKEENSEEEEMEECSRICCSPKYTPNSPEEWVVPSFSSP